MLTYDAYTFVPMFLNSTLIEKKLLPYLFSWVLHEIKIIPIASFDTFNVNESIHDR